MVILKYYNFLIFILFQKNLKKYDEKEAKLSALFFVSFVQLITAIAIFMQFSPNVKYFSRNLFLGFGIILFAVNYYYYVKKNKLNAIKAEFEDSDFNTKRNNVIGIIMIIFFLIFPLVVFLVSSYLKIKA